MTKPEDERKKRERSPLLSFIERPDPSGRAGESRAPYRDHDEEANAALERYRRARARQQAEESYRAQSARQQREAAEPPYAASASIGRSDPQQIRTEMAAVERELRQHIGDETDMAKDEPPKNAGSSGGKARPAKSGDDDAWRPLVDPARVLSAVLRSKKLIIATTVLGTLLGVAYAVSQPKYFYSTVEILIDPRELNIVDSEVTSGQLPLDATLAIADSQANIIQSSSVMTKVIDRAGLAKDPEFNGTLEEGGIGQFFSGIRDLFSRGGAESEAMQESILLRNMYQNVFVARNAKTYVFNITARSRNPEKAAVIANTVADVFQEVQGDIQSQTAKRATSILSERLADMQASVEAAENAVERFKAENDIVDVQGRTIGDDNVVRTNEQLAAARAETIRLNARAQSIRQSSVDSVIDGAMPEDLRSSVVMALRSQYASAKQQVDGLATKLGPRHPQYIQAQSQLATVRQEIQAEIRRINAAAQVELQRSVKQEQELAARLAQFKAGNAGTNEKQVKLRELQRLANAERAVYEAFLLRARQTSEQESIDTTNIRVISPARAALEPFGTSRKVVVVAAALLGFLFGLGLAILRGMYESFMGRRPEDEEDDRPAPVDPSPAPVPPGGERTRREADPADGTASSRLGIALEQARARRGREQMALDDEDADEPLWQAGTAPMPRRASSPRLRHGAGVDALLSKIEDVEHAIEDYERRTRR
ncbi:MAG: GumC family protein [Phyllobacterium sp.]